MLTDRLLNAVGQARCRYFDWRHGVHTCGDANLTDLTLVGSNANHGVFYHAAHPKFLFEVFSSLKIDYASYTFVDLGSGKGRALRRRQFPFAGQSGAEFDLNTNTRSPAKTFDAIEEQESALQKRQKY